MNTKKIHSANILLAVVTAFMAMPVIAFNQSESVTHPISVVSIKGDLSNCEKVLFNREYNQDSMIARIDRLEKIVFGHIQAGSIQNRAYNLKVQMPNSESAVSNRSLDKTPLAAPSRFAISKSLPKQVVTSPIPSRQNTASTVSPIDNMALASAEQRSWAASAIIDELLGAIEQADSQALNKAMDRLYDIQSANSDLAPEAARNANLFHKQGIAAFIQGKFDNALSNLQQALAANPSDISIINDLVKTQIKINDLKDAMIYCPVAIATEPSSATAWCNMAEIFARAKQNSRARDCAYLAYLMSEDSDEAVATIKESLHNISEPNIRAPFKQALLMAQYTPDNNSDSHSGSGKQPGFVGPEMDVALYKMNMLCSLAAELQQIKPDSGIVLAVTISRSGKILQKELLRSAGNTTSDTAAINAIADVKLPSLPKSALSDRQQFLVPVNRILKALADV